MRRAILLIILYFIAGPILLQAQDYLHAEGKFIYKETDEVILRGIGTGNWMLQEGYMMQTSDIAPTHHEFRNRLIQTIGESNTDSFYTAWLEWHFTRADVDSMNAWGFNSVRAAMHYKWFTLPIEDEPVPGENTWLEKGFALLDSLLDWCSDNEMYLILDLHGAPGGQGTDAAISDYDPSKPSLWESQENKDKTIALWRRLAERYSDETWIGGYDLINEPNWDFGNPNHTPLWNLLIEITNAIREVDQNHMIIIEGNWFANDYTGVPTPWDNNMVFSFHKYWTTNGTSSLDWIIAIRNNLNVPIWLGESGENSNTWFANLIALCETNHIGWSWWPVKKPRVNNPLRVEINEDYTHLIDYWRGNTPVPITEEAFQAVLGFAENHKIENCIYQKDVTDAMIRQPFTTETVPYSIHRPGQAIFATDYDLGRNNYAYFDTDTGDYHLTTGGDWAEWNLGWEYRNDGVDIELCSDTDESNGYNVGWTDKDEWLQYTLTTDSLAAYTLNIRYASNSIPGTIRILAGEVPLTGNISLPVTGNWQNWNTLQVEDIILPAGVIKVKVHVENSGSNLNYIKFTDPKAIDSVDFFPVYAETSIDGNEIILYLNKNVTSQSEDIPVSDFQVDADGVPVAIESLTIDAIHTNSIRFRPDEPVYYGNIIALSYIGNSVVHLVDTLEAFSDMEVTNNLPPRYSIPCRIQAEDFYINNGFELEICQDTEGGYNTAFANAGDYLDYLVHVSESAEYLMNFRVATIRSNAELIIQANYEEDFTSLDTILFTSTGDWQSWQTQSTNLVLDEGRYTLRLLVKQGEHNLNWFEFSIPSLVSDKTMNTTIRIYPNPAREYITLELHEMISGPLRVNFYDITGRLTYSVSAYNTSRLGIDIRHLYDGLYALQVVHNEGIFAGTMLSVMR